MAHWWQRYIHANKLERLLLDMTDAAALQIQACAAPDFDLQRIDKMSNAGVEGGDYSTIADRTAQAAMEQLRQKRARWSGVIAEEEDLRLAADLDILCDPMHAFFTFDGLDGTKSFGRGERTKGVGSMAAFVWDGYGVAAAIKDVFGGDVYWTLPISDVALHRRPDGLVVSMTHSQRVPLSEGAVLRCGNFEDCHPLIARLLHNEHGIFTSVGRKVSGSSIGLATAKVCRGQREVALVQPPNFDTPWDSTPVDVLARASGMVRLRPTEDGEALEEIRSRIHTQKLRYEYTMLTVHHSDIPFLEQHVPVRLL